MLAGSQCLHAPRLDLRPHREPERDRRRFWPSDRPRKDRPERDRRPFWPSDRPQPRDFPHKCDRRCRSTPASPPKLSSFVLEARRLTRRASSARGRPAFLAQRHDSIPAPECRLPRLLIRASYCAHFATALDASEPKRIHLGLLCQSGLMNLSLRFSRRHQLLHRWGASGISQENRQRS
jgi:hypothetical protein